MSSEFPLVCICVPTYNAAGTVRETLESILSQSYPNLVVHVSDNASTDDTLQIVESVADARVHIHRHEKNIGAEGNFSSCIQLAEGRYTAIFHSDDIYEPDMVTKQVNFLETHPSAGAVFTGASLIDKLGNKTGAIVLPQGIESKYGLYDFATMFKAVLRHSNFFICPSVMVRTNVYQQEIKYWRGELFNSGADLDIWLRILQLHPIGYLTEQLMRYRISNSQWSAKVRLGTERADFFLVTDHYLAQESVRILLAPEDLRNYRWLERRDKVMRAVNLLLTDRTKQAKGLLNDVFSWDALAAAIKTKRGLFVMIIGLYVLILIAIGMSKLGKLPLRYMKQAAGK